MILRTKYPRTFHLPWSEGKSDDDKVLSDDSQFNGKYVVVTEKMDGENTTIYSDGYVHARSVDSRSKPWQSWLQAYSAILFLVAGEYVVKTSMQSIQ